MENDSAQGNTATTPKTKPMPKLSIATIWMISFGFFGVQIAFSLQSSQMGRIFQTLGADPTKLGFFFILPPLAGLVVQPLVGYYSDKTWMPKIGRRLPYLLMGSLVAVIVMFLLPNSGSLGFGYGSLAALWFGAITILFMDLSSNVAMQPFKMMVGDMVNDEQKGFAYSIQSFLSNSGSVLAAIFPYLLTGLGVANIAPKGVIPNSVIFSFYTGAVILVICSAFTILRVKEYTPAEYNAYHGITEADVQEKVGLFTLLKRAPKVFWTLTLVQFFCWMAFQYLWTYGAGAVAKNVWRATDPASAGYQAGANWFGVLSAIYALAAVVWSLVLAKMPNDKHKPMYATSLVLGAVGFASIFVVHNQWVLILSFCLIGISWAAMMTFPFTILTNALSGANMGSYLGLFNGSICLPQIVASVLSFALFPLMGSSMPGMVLLAGILMLVGAFSVSSIKEVFA